MRPAVDTFSEPRQDRAVPAVLLSVPGNLHNGAESEVVEDLSRLISRPGSIFSICSPDSPGSFGWGFLAGLSDSIRYLRHLRHLGRKLAAFDILHLVFFPSVCSKSVLLLSVLLAKFLGKKVVLDYRNPVLPGNTFDRILLKRLWRVCDRVLVLTAFQQQLVNSTGGRAEFLRPTVDLDAIDPRVIRNVQPRVIVATELEREHNVACVIRACGLVKQKYPRTELMVVGSGSAMSVLEQMVSEAKLPGVTFTGSLPRQGRWECFENSDVYVNCSMIDSVSEATVEAFAFGLPVLTTPLSGGPEPLRSRENIILLAYNDHVGLAQRIIELVEDSELAEKLSVGSRQTAERHRPASAADRWDQIYGRLVVKSD